VGFIWGYLGLVIGFGIGFSYWVPRFAIAEVLKAITNRLTQCQTHMTTKPGGRWVPWFVIAEVLISNYKSPDPIPNPYDYQTWRKVGPVICNRGGINKQLQIAW